MQGATACRATSPDGAPIGLDGRPLIGSHIATHTCKATLQCLYLASHISNGMIDMMQRHGSIGRSVSICRQHAESIWQRHGVPAGVPLCRGAGCGARHRHDSTAATAAPQCLGYQRFVRQASIGCKWGQFAHVCRICFELLPQCTSACRGSSVVRHLISCCCVAGRSVRSWRGCRRRRHG